MDIKTKPIGVRRVFELRKMFKRALHEDFAYFPGEYIEKVNCDNTAWSLARSRLNSRRIILGLFEGKKMIGYAIADVSVPTESDIFWFYIIPERRRRGLGRKFFASLMERMAQDGARHVYLITHNQKGFYEAFDFKVQNENNNLFEGITMYEMSKDLV